MFDLHYSWSIISTVYEHRKPKSIEIRFERCPVPKENGIGGLMLANDKTDNLVVFRDCLGTALIEKFAPTNEKMPKKRAGKGRQNEIKPISKVGPGQDDQSNNTAELSDFIEVVLQRPILLPLLY